jgi:hypothetical protein
MPTVSYRSHAWNRFEATRVQWAPAPGWDCFDCGALVESNQAACRNGHDNQDRVTGHLYDWDLLAAEFRTTSTDLGWKVNDWNTDFSDLPTETVEALLGPPPHKTVLGLMATLANDDGRIARVGIKRDGGQCNVTIRYRRFPGLAESGFRFFPTVEDLMERMIVLSFQFKAIPIGHRFQ